VARITSPVAIREDTCGSLAQSGPPGELAVCALGTPFIDMYPGDR
jgi:hypothetical protein